MAWLLPFFQLFLIYKDFLMKKHLIMLGCIALLSACSSAYYGAMEKFGVYKRDILVSRVEEARDAQQDAKKQFDSALAQFRSVVNFDGGNLEKEYNRLQKSYDRSVAAAEDVSARIRSIEKVAEDLFKEWEKELQQYSNSSLRNDSQHQLSATRQEYAQLLRSLRAVEQKMPPVLSVFHDQVLYLKHNLNARAIRALHQEYRTIEGNVSRLIAEMNQSIGEAERFIQKMRQQ